MGEYNLIGQIRKIQAEIPEPNLSYALGYKKHLELENRKANTIFCRINELRYFLNLLGMDAKKATKMERVTFTSVRPLEQCPIFYVLPTA